MNEAQSCEICGGTIKYFEVINTCSTCERQCCDHCIHDNYVISGAGNEDEPRSACVDCVLADATTHSLSVQEEIDAREEITRGLRTELKHHVFAMEKFRGFMEEFCTRFCDKSGVSDDHEASAADTIQHTIPIAKLVDRCQESLDSVSTRMKMMRAECERAVQSETQQKQIVADISARLESMSQERDELLRSVKAMNETLCKMEIEMEQLSDIRNEHEQLKERCKRMEEQREAVSGRFSTSSIWERSDEHPTESMRSYLVSLCCPSLWL